MLRRTRRIRVNVSAIGVVLLLVTGSAWGSSWLPATPDGELTEISAAAAPEVTVQKVTDAGLAVSVTVPGVLIDPVKTKGGEFIEVDWPDASPSGQIGSPALPVIRRLFIAPLGVTVTIDVQPGLARLVTSDDVGLSLVVKPTQAPLPKLPGALANAPFDFDAQAYATNASLPAERATISELGVMRGQRLFMLEVYPVAYNPVAQELTLWNEISVNVHFEGTPLPSSRLSPLPGLERVVLNPEALPTGAPGVRGSGNYLIVVAQTFETDIVPFADAKTAQGFNVTTYPVPAGTSNSTIKSYIEGLWSDPGTAPEYILLVGDTGTVPHWVGGGDGSPDTDLPYTCMDGTGDWYPDIAIGRFPADNATELSTLVNKTLYTEDGPLVDPDYLKRAVFMASVDNYTISEGTHNYVIDTHLAPNGYTCDKLYQVTYGATTQDVRDSFNDGRFYGIYSGHGGSTSWADGPPFSQTDVRNLTNVDMYSYICSFACDTGDYTIDECFTETWVLADNAGVASWGSSVSSYWTEDDILERVLFDAIFDVGKPEAGPIYNEARVRYLAHFGATSTTRRYFEMYNLMGDPSLELPAGDTAMHVSPSSGLHSEGQAGGPFTPSSKVYDVQNVGDYAIDYMVTHEPAATWVTLSGALSGTLPPDGSAQITVEINSTAETFGNGLYEDTVYFTNTTDHLGDTTRDVTLTVGVPGLVYAYPLDADPGWTTQGLWAFGEPKGGGGQYGGPDPTSGYTGTNVYGYNLDGDYENYLSESHLTSTAIDCSNLTSVILKFQRWLGVERSTFDHAAVLVSNDGSTWTALWRNPDSHTEDSLWSLQEFDISSVADGQATVYLRWTMGTTDSSWQYCGWNIDDVEIWAIAEEEETCDDGILNQGEDRIDCGGPCPPCECTSDGMCDNGEFCDGEETCDDYGYCQDGTFPCTDPAYPYCDEYEDDCDECVENAHCDDDAFCNGAETCVDGSCYPGDDPCPGQECDEENDVCISANGDCDDDGDVDLQDFLAFQDCYTGPGGPVDPGCECADFDDDGDVDLTDFLEFQTAFTGPQ